MSNTNLFQISRVRARRALEKPAEGLDMKLILPVLALVLFGVIMVFSASYPSVLDNPEADTYFYVKRQGLFAVIGLLAFFAFSRLRLRHLQNIAYFWLVAAIGLLVAVLFIGREVNGARSWIDLGPFNFQPSEMAKVALMLALAKLLADHPNLVRTIKGLIPVFVMAGLVCGLVLLGRDFGTTAVAFAGVLALLFLAGARIKHLLGIALSAALAAAAFIAMEPYRIQRILSFLNPEQHAESGGYQIIRALIALGSGGPLGLGFSRSREKYFYLPTPHTDSIFAVIGEELGLVACLAVLAVFFWLGWRGLTIAASHPDRFGALAAAGMTNLIVLQAATNLFVIMGLLPPTGLPLPFVSYGGSSLLFSLIAVGIIANVSRSAASQQTRAFPDGTNEKAAPPPVQASFDQPRQRALAGQKGRARARRS